MIEERASSEMLHEEDRIWQLEAVNVEDLQAEAFFILDFLQDYLVDCAKLESCSRFARNPCCIERDFLYGT